MTTIIDGPESKFYIQYTTPENAEVPTNLPSLYSLTWYEIVERPCLSGSDMYGALDSQNGIGHAIFDGHLTSILVSDSLTTEGWIRCICLDPESIYGTITLEGDGE